MTQDGSLLLLTDSEFSLNYHRLVFRLFCHEKQGSAFQSFFEQIMELVDRSFIKVRPSGREGDWKCDGWSQDSGRCYQVYAPEHLTDGKAAAKISTDFNGAKEKWSSQLRSWIFVWSHHDALPPQAVAALNTIKEEHEGSIAVDQWGREQLWELVKKISTDDRIALLGAVPAIRQVSDSNAAEVQTLLNFLVRNESAETDDADLGLTSLSEKIKRNKLSKAVERMISAALPVARVVEDYVSKHPDIEYSAIVATALGRAYKRAVESGMSDPDDIFGHLVQFVSQGSMVPKQYWSAVGIVAHYFQLCEIFER